MALVLQRHIFFKWLIRIISERAKCQFLSTNAVATEISSVNWEIQSSFRCYCWRERDVVSLTIQMNSTFSSSSVPNRVNSCEMEKTNHNKGKKQMSSKFSLLMGFHLQRLHSAYIISVDVFCSSSSKKWIRWQCLCAVHTIALDKRNQENFDESNASLNHPSQSQKKLNTIV